MNEYQSLENRLKESNKQLDEILNSSVTIKLICIYNSRILLENGNLPSINITKGMLNNNNVIELSNNILNIKINNVESVPFEYYNNYDERYYIISIDNDNMLSINNIYTFNDIDDIVDVNEQDVLSKLSHLYEIQ